MPQVRLRFSTPEIDDLMFLGLLYPLARDGWLDSEKEGLPGLDDFPAPYWPKHERTTIDGEDYSGANSTVTKKAWELEAGHSGYGPRRQEAFSAARRGKISSSSAPGRDGPMQDKEYEELRSMIWLWFANRCELRGRLKRMQAGGRSEWIHKMRCDQRFLALREVAARAEGVYETFGEMIQLERREQERLRQLSKREKRRRIQRLLRREPGLSNGVLSSIFKCSPQSVLNYRNELEATGEIAVLDTRRDTVGRRQPAKRHRSEAFLDTSTNRREVA